MGKGDYQTCYATKKTSVTTGTNFVNPGVGGDPRMSSAFYKYKAEEGVDPADIYRRDLHNSVKT